MKKLIDDLEEIGGDKLKVNPLIYYMTFNDPGLGKLHIQRENTDSTFYNCSNILDENHHKIISTIVDNSRRK
jgi:hypothetical protein